MNEDGGKIIILHSSNHSLSTYIRDRNGNIEYQSFNNNVNSTDSDAICFNKYLYQGIPWPRDNMYKKIKKHEVKNNFLYLLLIPLIPAIVYSVFHIYNFVNKWIYVVTNESRGFRRIKESF